MPADQIAEARIGHQKLILWARWGGTAGGWVLSNVAKPGPLAFLYRSPQCWHPREPKPEYPTDQEALETDKLVSSMQPKYRDAVAAHYLFRWRPESRLLKAIGISRATWYRAIDHARFIVGVENRKKQLYA
jgi:hypothetical protein